MLSHRGSQLVLMATEKTIPTPLTGTLDVHKVRVRALNQPHQLVGSFLILQTRVQQILCELQARRRINVELRFQPAWK